VLIDRLRLDFNLATLSLWMCILYLYLGLMLDLRIAVLSEVLIKPHLHHFQLVLLKLDKSAKKTGGRRWFDLSKASLSAECNQAL